MTTPIREESTQKLNLLPYKFKDLFDYGPLKPLEGGPNLVENLLKTCFSELSSGDKYRRAFKEILKSLPEVPNSKALVGIEIEVEMCPSISVNGWTQHKEGSLRNNGKEFVSIPLQTNAVNILLAEIYAVLGFVKGIDFSWRTSTHIHLDLRDATLEQLIRILLVYAIFEKILFIFVGEERDKSIFCVPLTESWLTNGISKFISGDFSIGGLQDEWEKYSAFNLFRLKDYGTVEFRHLGGTFHPERISTWVSLLVSIYNSAVEMSTEELIEVIENLNTSSRFEEFKERVFGKELSKVLIVPNTKLIEQGVTFCKECLSKAYYPLKLGTTSALEEILKKQKKSEQARDREQCQKNNLHDHLKPLNKMAPGAWIAVDAAAVPGLNYVAVENAIVEAPNLYKGFDFNEYKKHLFEQQKIEALKAEMKIKPPLLVPEPDGVFENGGNPNEDF